MFDEAKIAEIIQAVCRKWYWVMPEGCRRVMDIDDLVQEARIADIQLRPRYDPAGASYTTLLWRDLNLLMHKIYNRFKVRRKYWSYNYDIGLVGTNTPDPERETMVLDFVDKVCDISQGFGDMVMYGIPMRLRYRVEYKIHSYRLQRGWDPTTGQFRVSQAVIENYFDVKIRKLRSLFYNCL
jgi:hypothetical protein